MTEWCSPCLKQFNINAPVRLLTYKIIVYAFKRACVCVRVCEHVCMRARARTFVSVFSFCVCRNCLMLRRPMLTGNVGSDFITAVNCCTDLCGSKLFTVSDGLY